MKKPENINLIDWKLLKRKYSNLDPIVSKIKNNYPVQYLIGNVDFYGNIINVNKNVLIPRFETETLVEKTIEYLKKLNLTNSCILEIGTGSGCISIALKTELPKIQITAMDICKKALKVAKKNAKNNQTKISFINKNLFKYNLLNKYDVIISNPPYIKKGDIIDPKTDYEPCIALYSDETGIKFYEKIFQIAEKSLNKKFLIALEIEETIGKDLKKIARKYFKNVKITLEKDLAGKDRYLFIMNK